MPMSYGDDPDLFCGPHLDEVLTEARRSLGRAVDSLPERELREAEIDELVARVVAAGRIGAVEMPTDEIARLPVEDAELDVTGNARYGHSLSGGRVRAPARKVVFTVPFAGEKAILHRKPNPCQVTVMRGKVVRVKSLPPRTEFQMTRIATTDVAAADIEEDVQLMLGHIMSNVRAANRQVDTHNASLKATAREMIERRRAQIAARVDFDAGFRTPVRDGGA